MTRRQRLVLILLVLLAMIGGWLYPFVSQGRLHRDKAELLLAKAVVGMGIEWRWAQQVVAIDVLTRRMEVQEVVKAADEVKRRIQDRRERDLVWLHAEHGED